MVTNATQPQKNINDNDYQPTTPKRGRPKKNENDAERAKLENSLLEN